MRKAHKNKKGVSNMKRTLALLITMVLVLTAVFVVTVGAFAEAKKLVAFSQGDNGNSWRATNTKDMEEWAIKSGYDYIWADGKGDASKQLSDIQDLLSRKPDILIVAPVQAEAVTPCVKMAADLNIPLITIDRKVNAEVGEGTYKANIVQDFVEVGRIQGRYVVQKLTERYGEPKGKVLEITGTTGASASIEEGQGIREILKDYPNIEIVDSQDGDYMRTTARNVMDDFLNKYPEGSVDYLICYNDDMAIGAMQAMEDAGRTDLLGYIASKDGLRDALKEIIDGNIHVSAQCTPYFGEITMELVGKILNGETHDATTDVPFKTFDMSENKQMTEEYYQHLLDQDLFF